MMEAKVFSDDGLLLIMMFEVKAGFAQDTIFSVFSDNSDISIFFQYFGLIGNIFTQFLDFLSITGHILFFR